MSVISTSDTNNKVVPVPKDISSYTVLRVQKYDPDAQAISQKRLIEVPESATFENGTLEDLRKFLINENVFDSPE